MTENADSSTDKGQTPASWPDRPGPTSWAAIEGSIPGPSWRPPPPGSPSSGNSGPYGPPADQTPLEKIRLERPEVIIGAAFAGGVLLALILKRLAR